MSHFFNVARIDIEYCDYLRKFDSRVSYNKGKKELRPFVGVLFKIQNCEYFTPLTSPKEKHVKMKNMPDFIKIDEGKLGALNFNNMIPVTYDNYTIIDLNRVNLSEKEANYQNLLNAQIRWLNRNEKQVRGKAEKLYLNYILKKLPKNIYDRCCNFKLLEEKCKLYNQDK